MGNKSICIVNAHWSNRGDEAALRPIINSIDTIITVIFKDRKSVIGFPYNGRVKHISAQFLPESQEDVLQCIEGSISSSELMAKEIECIKKSDMIIYSPGGAVIADKFWWKKQIEYLTPFICAEKFNIPIIVAAPSMGPFEDIPERNNLRKHWLSVSKKIIVRESMTAEYLKSIGISENLLTTIDTAFYDDFQPEICMKTFTSDKDLMNFFGKYNKIVGLTLSDFSWHVELSKEKGLQEKTNKAIKSFLKQMKLDGIGIILIPQLFCNQNDIDYLNQYANEENIFVLSEKYDTYFQQYVISKCYALVGMRYHSCIFAAKAGIPFIALGYEAKMFGFMKDWKLENFLLKILNVDELSLMEKWKLLTSYYDEYHTKLVAYREIWREEASKTINYILSQINNIK